MYPFAGFRAVELSADVPDEWSIEQLLVAKEGANVEVVGLCAQTGMIGSLSQGTLYLIQGRGMGLVIECVTIRSVGM